MALWLLLQIQVGRDGFPAFSATSAAEREGGGKAVLHRCTELHSVPIQDADLRLCPPKHPLARLQVRSDHSRVVLVSWADDRHVWTSFRPCRLPGSLTSDQCRPLPEEVYGEQALREPLLGVRRDTHSPEMGERLDELPLLERLLRCQHEPAHEAVADRLWEW